MRTSGRTGRTRVQPHHQRHVVLTPVSPPTPRSRIRCPSCPPGARPDPRPRRGPGRGEAPRAKPSEVVQFLPQRTYEMEQWRCRRAVLPPSTASRPAGRGASGHGERQPQPDHPGRYGVPIVAALEPPAGRQRRVRDQPDDDPPAQRPHASESDGGPVDFTTRASSRTTLHRTSAPASPARTRCWRRRETMSFLWFHDHRFDFTAATSTRAATCICSPAPTRTRTRKRGDRLPPAQRNYTSR